MSLDKDTNSRSVLIPTPRVILSDKRQTLLNVTGSEVVVMHYPIVSAPALTTEFMEADPRLHLSVYRYNRGHNRGSSRVNGWRWSYPADPEVTSRNGYDNGKDHIGNRRSTWQLPATQPMLDILGFTGAQVVADWFKAGDMTYVPDMTDPDTRIEARDVLQFTGGRKRHSTGAEAAISRAQREIAHNVPRYSAAKPLHGWFRFAFSVADPSENPADSRGRIYGPPSRAFRVQVLANDRRQHVFTPQGDGTVAFRGSTALLCEWR